MSYYLNDVYQLTDKEKEYASTMLNETRDSRQSGLAEIKQWIIDSEDLCASTGNSYFLYTRCNRKIICQTSTVCKEMMNKSNARKRTFFMVQRLNIRVALMFINTLTCDSELC